MAVEVEQESAPKPPKVLITIPNTGHIGTKTHETCYQMFTDRRVSGSVSAPQDPHPLVCMNRIVKGILEEDYDFWINLDWRVAPCRNPVDLVLLDHDIIGMPYLITGPLDLEAKGWFHTAFMETPSGGWKEAAGEAGKGGLQVVHGIGTGAMVVSRRVLEHPKMKAPFLPRWDTDGLPQLGMDLSFCKKARAAGFKVETHYGYPAEHVTEVHLGKLVQNVKSYYEDQERKSPNGSIASQDAVAGGQQHG